MANDNKSASKFSIVRKISEFLKLGDDGKLDSFFTRIEKTLKNEIVLRKKNIEIEEFNTKNQIEKYEYQLEDAKEALEEAFLNVDVNQVATNHLQEKYVDRYLANISVAEGVITDIEESVAKAKEALKDFKSSQAKDIKRFEARIKTIKS